MRFVAASDHAGLNLRRHLVERLRAAGHEVVELGIHTSTSTDYPDWAAQVARAVGAAEADRGLLVCGTGQGMAMTANRFPGVRAALAHDVFSARATRAHNDANVLCLGERVIGTGAADLVLDAFVETPFEGGRHAGRIAKIASYDKERP